MQDIQDLGGIGGIGRIEPPASARGGRGAPFALPGASRCLVCGSRAVRTDEVARDPREEDGARRERGRVLLAECRHCDHRWTRPLPEEPAPRRAAARARPEREPAESAEVVSAA